MMSDFIVINGTLTDRPPAAPDEPYVYQRLHVSDGRPLDVAAHVDAAARAARGIFGVDFGADACRTDALCREMLRRNRYPAGVSSCIDLRVYASGEARWSAGEIFVGRGLVLRALRPEALVVSYGLPFGEAPTSAREAACRLAAAAARRLGCGSVVRCDEHGTALTADDAPLFVVRGERVYTSPTVGSVERDRAMRAVRASGLPLREVPVLREHLKVVDEAFYCDCRGITSLAGCDGVPYMDIMTRRVARYL
ncbi:MAG: aminotransferase class IV [Alistipes sp.]|nr:aminotransferase class IV [Alistipes sp.]